MCGWLGMSVGSPSVWRMTQLTIREHMALQLEQSWWKWPAAKETRAREELGMSGVRYAQVVNALIDRPEALVAYPMVVRRLGRLREARRRARTQRDFASASRM